MIFNVIVLVIGILISGAGIYYLIKEKSDSDSRKIYTITVVAGVVVTVFGLIRFLI